MTEQKKTPMTGEQYTNMIEALENGSFIPTANENAPQPLYEGYSGWAEFLEYDKVALDEISSQYLDFISRQ